MKNIFLILGLTFTFFGCKKSNSDTGTCDMAQINAGNAAKLTTTNGIWGTLANMEGNCMPMIDPGNSTCKTCPVKRVIKIYPYTLFSNAIPNGNSNVFFNSFNNPIIAETTADANGFFQISLVPGRYSIAIVENGKLYANGGDGFGGINPIIFNGGLQNVNLTMTYKAVF